MTLPAATWRNESISVSANVRRSVSNFAKTPSLLHFSGASKGEIGIRSGPRFWSVSDILIYLSAILSPDLLEILSN